MNAPRFPTASLDRRRLALLLAGLACGMGLPGRAAGSAPVPSPLSSGAAALGDALFAAPGGANRLASPWSVFTALSMLQQGARRDTARDMAEALASPTRELRGLVELHRAARLALSDTGDEAVSLTLAQAGWTGLDRWFLRSYRSRVTRAFNAPLRRVGFGTQAAAEAINDWAKQATKGLIPTLVDDVPASAEFVLTTAIHFLGRWSEAFDPARTAPGPFLLASGGTRDVALMKRTADGLPYARSGDLHAVRLGYGTGRFRLTLLTATEPQAAGVVLDRVAKDGLGPSLAALEFRPARIELALPRCKVESSADLLPVLRAGRFEAALAPDADFANVNGRAAQISAVLHRATVEFTEAGTEAAAATAVIATRSMPAPPILFAADRPFLFAIEDTATGILLFSGRIGDPA